MRAHTRRRRYIQFLFLSKGFVMRDVYSPDYGSSSFVGSDGLFFKDQHRFVLRSSPFFIFSIKWRLKNFFQHNLQQRLIRTIYIIYLVQEEQQQRYSIIKGALRNLHKKKNKSLNHQCRAFYFFFLNKTMAVVYCIKNWWPVERRL